MNFWLILLGSTLVWFVHNIKPTYKVEGWTKGYIFESTYRDYTLHMGFVVAIPGTILGVWLMLLGFGVL